jgi:hypothetical protein
VHNTESNPGALNPPDKTIRASPDMSNRKFPHKHSAEQP